MERDKEERKESRKGEEGGPQLQCRKDSGTVRYSEKSKDLINSTTTGTKMAGQLEIQGQVRVQKPNTTVKIMVKRRLESEQDSNTTVIKEGTEKENWHHLARN